MLTEQERNAAILEGAERGAKFAEKEWGGVGDVHSRKRVELQIALAEFSSSEMGKLAGCGFDLLSWPYSCECCVPGERYGACAAWHALRQVVDLEFDAVSHVDRAGALLVIVANTGKCNDCICVSDVCDEILKGHIP